MVHIGPSNNANGTDEKMLENRSTDRAADTIQTTSFTMESDEDLLMTGAHSIDSLSQSSSIHDQFSATFHITDQIKPTTDSLSSKQLSGKQRRSTESEMCSEHSNVMNQMPADVDLTTSNEIELKCTSTAYKLIDEW